MNCTVKENHSTLISGKASGVESYSTDENKRKRDTRHWMKTFFGRAIRALDNSEDNLTITKNKSKLRTGRNKRIYINNDQTKKDVKSKNKLHKGQRNTENKEQQ